MPHRRFSLQQTSGNRRTPFLCTSSLLLFSPPYCFRRRKRLLPFSFFISLQREAERLLPVSILKIRAARVYGTERRAQKKKNGGKGESEETAEESGGTEILLAVNGGEAYRFVCSNLFHPLLLPLSSPLFNHLCRASQRPRLCQPAFRLVYISPFPRFRRYAPFVSALFFASRLLPFCVYLFFSAVRRARIAVGVCICERACVSACVRRFRERDFTETSSLSLFFLVLLGHRFHSFVRVCVVESL